MTHQIRRFIDHQQVFVFVKNVEQGGVGREVVHGLRDWVHHTRAALKSGVSLPSLKESRLRLCS